MDYLKEAFLKIKKDMEHLRSEISEIKRTLQINPTNQQINSTNQQINPTNKIFPTHNLPLEAVKRPNIDISIGNEGVPTNKPTNKPTNRKRG